MANPDDRKSDTQLPADVFEDLFGGEEVAGSHEVSPQPSNATRNAGPAATYRDEQRPAAHDGYHQEPGGGVEGALSAGPIPPERAPAAAPAHREGARRGRDAGGNIASVTSAVARFIKRTTGGRGNRDSEHGSSQPSVHTRPAGRATPTPENLAELENRMKISLRETSLQNIARICVGSPKGGVGKSSTAYGIAGAISYYTNMRVVLVDADPNFGSTRLLVPRPIQPSVVDLARDAGELEGLSHLRSYIAQNEKMRLDVVLGPEHAYELAEFDDLGDAYERIDRVLARHYDVIVYDLGLGFRDPAIRQVLALCNELMFVTDSEVIPNAMLTDGIAYIQHLGVDLDRTTLVINHRLPKQHESADTSQVRDAATKAFRHVTDIPYDDSMSQLLNRRAFHIESLTPDTRRGILTTLAACLEGLMHSTQTGETVSGARKAAGKAGAARAARNAHNGTNPDTHPGTQQR